MPVLPVARTGSHIFPQGLKPRNGVMVTQSVADEDAWWDRITSVNAGTMICGNNAGFRLDVIRVLRQSSLEHVTELQLDVGSLKGSIHVRIRCCEGLDA